MSHLPTTTAGVRYTQQLDFEDSAPSTQIWLIEVRVDGPAPNIQTEVRFPGSANAAAKRLAVRAIVNAHIGAYENGNSIGDAAIQISGQPV
jgi:hypothetical protein